MKIGFLTTCLPECSFNDVIDFAKLDKKMLTINGG